LKQLHLQNEREIAANHTAWRIPEFIFPFPYDHSFQDEPVAADYSYKTFKSHVSHGTDFRAPMPPLKQRLISAKMLYLTR
jgi:hypothetical protein